MEAALRQAAQTIDNGEQATDDAIRQASGTSDAGKTADTKAGDDKTASEGSARKADTDPTATGGKDKDGKDKKDTKDTTQPGKDAKAGDNKDSDYTKAQKDKDRFERNWAGLNQRTEALKQQAAEIERRERELTEREQRVTAGAERRQAEPLKDDLGFTAEQYDEGAKKFEARGEFELADAAKKNAQALREKEKTAAANTQREQSPAQRKAPPEQLPDSPEFKEKWNGHLKELEASEEYADLKNKESELFKATATLLGSEPRLRMFNDGIRIAAEVARGRIAVASVSALRTQITEANKELDKLRKATAPSNSDGESRGAAKTFDQLSAAEQEAEIRKNAALVDQG
jgi:hypothetical protein